MRLRARNQIALVALFWAAYSVVRQITAEDLERAMSNAERLQSFQNQIGLGLEATVQRLLIDLDAVVIAANWYYLFHFPVFVLVAVTTFALSPGTFRRLRNATLATTGAGLLLHLAIPLAPPRMLSGFVDTGLTYGPSPYAFPGSEGANQLAAMPSLHVAWAGLACFAVWHLTTSRNLRVAAVAHPTITAAVVVITANHYITDVIIGAAIAATTWYVARPRTSSQLVGSGADVSGC